MYLSPSAPKIICIPYIGPRWELPFYGLPYGRCLFFSFVLLRFIYLVLHLRDNRQLHYDELVLYHHERDITQSE